MPVFNRNDFDHVSIAKCIKPIEGLLTEGHSYHMYDTSPDTIDVKDDNANIESYPMDHFEPVPSKPLWT